MEDSHTRIYPRYSSPVPREFPRISTSSTDPTDPHVTARQPTDDVGLDEKVDDSFQTLLRQLFISTEAGKDSRTVDHSQETNFSPPRHLGLCKGKVMAPAVRAGDEFHLARHF